MVEVLHCVLCDYALKTNDVADVLIWSSGVFRSGGGEGKRETERENNLRLSPLIISDAECSDLLHPQTLWRHPYWSNGPGQSFELHLFIIIRLPAYTLDNTHDSLDLGRTL